MLHGLGCFLRDLLVKNRFFITKGNSVQIPFSTRWQMKKMTIKVSGSGNRLIIREHAQLSNCEIRLRGHGNRIEIGDDVRIKSGRIFLMDTQGQHIRIGQKTTIQGAFLLVDEAASIDIGNDCMLSTDIIIRCGDKHSILDNQSGQRINPAKSIKIHDRVWIGRDVQILKGSELLPETVVGTRSLVTQAFAEGNCIVGGVPAKVIRRSIRWDRDLL
jgi:acetyltransferase-like isoleucine patch superfamily enzyme